MERGERKVKVGKLRKCMCKGRPSAGTGEDGEEGKGGKILCKKRLSAERGEKRSGR